MQGGQKPGYVPGCFVGKLAIEIPEVVEIVDLLPGDDLENPPFPAVVGSQRREPVAEEAVKIGQVGDGGLGRFLDVHALVDERIPVEPVLVSRRRDELPGSQGPGLGKGMDLESAFNKGKPCQLLRETRLPQLLLHDGKVVAGPFVGALEEVPLDRLEAPDFLFHVGVHDERDLALLADRRRPLSGVDIQNLPGDQQPHVVFLADDGRAFLLLGEEDFIGLVQGLDRIVHISLVAVRLGETEELHDLVDFFIDQGVAVVLAVVSRSLDGLSRARQPWGPFREGNPQAACRMDPYPRTRRRAPGFSSWSSRCRFAQATRTTR